MVCVGGVKSERERERDGESELASQTMSRILSSCLSPSSAVTLCWSAWRAPKTATAKQDKQQNKSSPARPKAREEEHVSHGGSQRLGRANTCF